MNPTSMVQTRLFDGMRDAGVERLRFKRTAEGFRMLAARKDGSWEPASSLLPDLTGDMDAVLALFRIGGHERLDLVYRDEVGMRFLCAVHSTEQGPGAGGLRRHELSDPEIEVIQDLLNLARAMTYKNKAAGLGRGGSKLCVHNPGIPDYAREQWLTCLAEEVDFSGTVTGPDTGYESSVYRELAERSFNVSGVRDGGTARSAAVGVIEALRATSAALGRPVGETRFAVQGLGRLGAHVAEELAGAGASLVVTDKDHRRIDALVSSLTPETRERVQVCAPYQILGTEADVLVPCAVGGVIHGGIIRDLNVRAICGGANNQLQARSLDEELDLARDLMGGGILFVPDWLASAGGAIHGVMELTEGETFDVRHALARIHRVCGWMVDEVLGEARATGHAPLEIAVSRYLSSE